MEVTPAMVMKLRAMTGLPMMECKRALIEARGDYDAAIDILRRAGRRRIEKMAERSATEGRIACFVDREALRGGIVELRCETAPVASTDDFIRLAATIARAAAGMEAPTPETVRAQPLPDDPSRTVGDLLLDVFNRLRENIQIARVGSLRGHVGCYVHHDARKGALVEMSGACPEEVSTGVCMHIVSMRPPVVRREDVDPQAVARERLAAAAEAAGKPPAVVDKIVEGKLSRWFSEFVLLEQPYVRDEKYSVGQMLHSVSPGLTVRRFLRYELGAE